MSLCTPRNDTVLDFVNLLPPVESPKHSDLPITGNVVSLSTVQ